MEAIVGSDDITLDGRRFALSTVVGIIATDAGVSVTVRSGESFIAGDNSILSVLSDKCPWAVCGV